MRPAKVHFVERMALPQFPNALNKLRRMKRRQWDYVRTNIGQTVSEIIFLARRYEADISIEKSSRFRPNGRKFNKRVLAIPLHPFRRISEARCFDNSIALNRADAYHTSKWCSCCGAAGKGHDGSNHVLFRRRECGQVVNSDRNANLALAVKTLLERNGVPNQNTFQISGRRVPVNGLFRGSDAS